MSLFLRRLILAGITLWLVTPAWSQAVQPVVSQGGVLNAADYSTSIAGGSMVAIFGTNLAAEFVVATEVPLQAELGGVKVEIVDGGLVKDAAIWFVSPTQINAQLPFKITNSTVQLRVKRNGRTSAGVSVAISRCGPGFYTWSGTGQGAVAALHNADWSLVSENSPAVPEEYLILYATGLGPVTYTPPTGRPGGDNQWWGAINYAEDPVTVTIGGKSATVLFAGLAPGFVGLYQINIQVPKTLSAGDHQITVRAGSWTSQGDARLQVGPGGSQGGGGDIAEVVKRAMEAQVRGDVEGFLAECATEEAPAEARENSLELLNLVRSYVTFSNFQFTHLATGLGDQGGLALVRAVVSFTAQAKDGSHEMTVGLFSSLKKINGQWKIIHIIPDDLMNQQIYEESDGKSMSSAGYTPREAGQAINLEDFNKAINAILSTGDINEEKAGRSALFGVIGQFGFVGDIMANTNQVIELFENSGGTLMEVYENGFTGIAVLKFKQVAVGVMQIVAEPIPGLDAQTDMMQAGLEQLTHNLELARDLGLLRNTIRQIPSGSIPLTPYLYPYPAYMFKYAAGVEMKPMDNAPEHSYGVPLGAIEFTAPTALDNKIPLTIIGEIPFAGSSPIAPFALRLGGRERGGTIYFPVEVGYLAEEDVSSGDAILDDYHRYRTTDSVSRVVTWNVTCRRGKQEVKVRLRTGETTPAVKVANAFMNKVDELMVTGGGSGEIEVAEDSSVTGIRILGAGAQLEQRFWPDLTARNECFDVAIGNPDIASLDRGETITINGVKAGETTMEMLLAGGTDADVPELQSSMPVKVTGEPGLLFEDRWTTKFYNNQWEVEVTLRIHSLGGDLQLRTDQTAGAMRQLVMNSPGGGNYMVSVGISGLRNLDGNPPKNFKVYGQLTPAEKSAGSDFTTMIKVPDDAGNTAPATAFNIILYSVTETGTENWIAGDALLYLQIRKTN